MPKILYTFLLVLLASAYFISPSKAMESEWFLEKEYDHSGTVFPTFTCVYKKEENNKYGWVKYSPKTPENLTPATVQFLSSQAILHDKYHEVRTAHVAIRSFIVTPNSTGLTRDSTDVSSLPTKIYGSIPVSLYTVRTNLDLIIFPENEAVHAVDYAQTMGSALEIILAQYIPMMKKTGHFSDLETITISDGDPSIAQHLLKRKEEGSEINKFIFQTHSPIEPGRRPNWEMVFKVNNP